MAKTIEELAVRFSAQTEDLNRELRRLEATAARSGKRVAKKVGGIQKSLNAVSNSAKTAGAALLAAFAGRELITGVRDLFEGMNDLQTSADGLGTSVENIQELRFAFIAAGADAGKVEGVLRDFTKRIGEAKQNLGTLLPFLKTFDIELRNTNGSMKSTDQLFREVTDIIAGMTSETDRAALGNAAFGRSWVDVVAVLKNGSVALSEVIDGAREVGAIMSSDLVEAAAAADVRFNILANTLTTRVKTGFLKTLQAMKLLDKTEKQLFAERASETINRKAQLEKRLRNIELQSLKKVGREKREKEKAEIQKELSEIGSSIKSLRIEKDKLLGITDGGDVGEIISTKTVDTALRSLNVLREEVFKFQNDQFAIIERGAEQELAVFQDLMDKKKISEMDFLEAKKLVEEKRVHATLKANIDIEKAQIESAKKLQKIQEEIQKKKDEAIREAARQAEMATRALAAVFESTFEDALLKGENLGKLFKSLLKDIARLAIRQAIIKPLVSGVTGGISSVLGFAKGGVMTPTGPRSLPAFAGGGVSRTPAIFGEAGPEAAVPLPDGRRIPVEMKGGGGVTVVQNITIQQGTQKDTFAAIGAVAPIMAEQSQLAVQQAQRGIAF